MSNLYAVEAELIQRITDTVTGFESVLDESTFAEATEVTRLLDAAIVQADGAELLDQGEDEIGLLIERQQWTLIVAVPNLPAAAMGGETTATHAGALLYEVMRNIIGWSPEGAYRPFRYVDRPPPDIRLGHSLFPVTLEVVMGIGL